MSFGDTGHSDPAGGQPPTEEELRAAYEAEIKQIRVEQVLLEQIVTLINLGMRRTGLSPGTEDERDLEQVRLAIEGVRVQLPLIEPSASGQIGQIRDALSQLQMAFVRLGGARRPVVPKRPGLVPGPARRRRREPTRARHHPGLRPPSRLPRTPSPGSPGSRARRSAVGGSGYRASSRAGRRFGRRHARLAAGLGQGLRTFSRRPFWCFDQRTDCASN